MAIAIVAAGLALGVRRLVDPALPPGVPFIAFYPAITLTAFFASTRAGIVTAVLCGAAAWVMYLNPLFPMVQGIVALAFFACVVGTDLILIHLMRQALVKLDSERKVSDTLAQANKLMFHELQHRVSNNLQVVASILKMQQRGLTDEAARAALDAASARLRIISGIQRRLHNPKRQSADIAALLRELLPEVVESSGAGGAGLEVHGGGVVLPADQATPVGLIVVELVSNALEHAQGTALQIRITVQPGVRITVSDNGPGMPNGFEAQRTRSLGLRIAMQFTEQLGGKLVFSAENGTQAVLEFPA